MSDTFLVTCEGTGEGGGCGFNQQGVEPYYGDIGSSEILTDRAICCNI